MTKGLARIVAVAFLSLSTMALAWYLAQWRLPASSIQSRGGSQTYDFGEGRSGEVVTHVFQFRNPTSVELRVSNVHTSCGCTVLRTDLRAIGPKETVQIPVEVKLGNPSPEFSSDVTVFFHDRGSIQFRMQGRVIEELPRVVSFGDVLQNGNASRRFLYRALTRTPISIQDINFDQKYVAVTRHPYPENVRDVEFEVKLLNDIPYGKFSTDLHIQTQDISEPNKTVVISGYVLRPLEAEPRYLTLSMSEDLSKGGTTVELYSPYGSTIEFESASVTPLDLLQCGKPLPGGARSRITIPIAVAKGEFKKGVSQLSIAFSIKVSGIRQVIDVPCYVWSPN